MSVIRFCHHLPGTTCDVCRPSVPLPPSTTLPYTPFTPYIAPDLPAQVPSFTITNTSPTIAEFEALVKRVKALELAVGNKPGTLEDADDEIEAPGMCPECGFALTLVRPGKHQCDVCETIDANVAFMLDLAARIVRTSGVPKAEDLAKRILALND